jgi:hypothetical protein
MAKRTISITYDFRPGEPIGGQEADIRRAFEELGWRVTYYGGGSSNVDRCYLDIESGGPELDHPTLIATLRRLGIPLSEDPLTGISIYGEVAMEARAVGWAVGREHLIQGVRLKVSNVVVLPKDKWFDGGAKGILPVARVRCEVTPAPGTVLRAPFVLTVEASTDAGEPVASSGMNWPTATSVARDSIIDLILNRRPSETLTLTLRALDLHRAWQVAFRGVPVDRGDV